MATYEYGAPSPVPVRVLSPVPATEKPRCWGKSFDETDRECRGCGFQNSCKEELIRKNVHRPMTPPPYYAPQPVRSYATPQPVQPLHQPITSYPYHQPSTPPGFQMATVAKALAPMMHPQPMTPASSGHRYGWLQDPLYYTINAAPPPMRVQMNGESFFERALKNALLGALERGAAECFLAIRQMLLAPPVPTVEIQPVTPTVGQCR